jgi:hypothetical protein
MVAPNPEDVDTAAPHGLQSAAVRYRITSSTAEKTALAFSMPERPLLTVFLLLVAAACLLLGLAFALPGDEPPRPAESVGFLGFGMFSLCAVFLLARGIAYPRRILFDSSRGWLSLSDARGALEGAVPFDGIAGISVLRSVSSGIVRRAAGIDLKRGGRWELYASRSERRVTAFAERLSAAVRLGAPVGEPPGPAVRPAAENLPGGGVRYLWRRRPRPLSLAVSLAAVLGFVGALIGVRAFASTSSTVVALLFAALLLAVTAAGLIRSVGERHTVEISAAAVSWSRRSAFSRPKGFTLPLSSVAAVDLSFSFTRMETAISLLGPGETERFRGYRQGTFGPAEAVSLLGFLRALPRIDVSALSLGERLGLEEAIRSAAASAGSGS